MGKYRTLGNFFDRIFRNDLNKNFEDIDIDLKRLGAGSEEALRAADEADTQAIYANDRGDYADEKGTYAAEQGDYANTKGDYADEKGILADEAATKAELVATENKTRFLDAVDTITLRDSTYPSPTHGDTVRVTSTATSYRFVEGAGWVKTDEYNPTAIDEVTAQIADKANESEVRKNAVKLELEDMSDKVISAVTGGATVNVLSIPQDKSVSYEKTDFMYVGKNLVDETKLVIGENVGVSTGVATLDATSKRTDYLSIDETKKYRLGVYRYTDYVLNNTQYRIAFYDINKLFISGYTGFSEVGEITPPVNSKYLRLSINNLTRLIQLEVGSVSTAHEKFYAKFKDSVKIDIPPVIIDDIDFESTNFVAVGKNVIDETKLVIGENVGISTGVTTLDATSKRTDYVSIDETKGYILSVYRHTDYLLYNTQFRIAFYNASKVFISGYSSFSEFGAIVIPPVNSKYLRLSIKNLTRLIQLEAGSVSTHYESYNLQFKQKQLVVADANEIYNYGKFSMEHLSDWYSSKNISHTDFNHSTTIGDFHAAFNNLLSAYPSYATVTNLGLDSSGSYPIYRYDLTPENVSHGEYFGEPLPKIIIINGQHGDEKEGIFALYYLVKDMLENWNKDSTLEYLRFNLRFVIVPCNNPSGFVNATRVNSNGVDLNRNYDYNWQIDTSTAKGVAPFSEVESQYIRDIIISNSDALLLIDYHTNGSSGTSYYLTNAILLNEGVYYNQDIVDASYYHVKKTTRKFNKMYDSGNNGESFGYISIGREESMLKNYSAQSGVASAVFEGFEKFPNEVGFMSDVTIKANVELMGNWLSAVIEHFRHETKTFEIVKG